MKTRQKIKGSAKNRGIEKRKIALNFFTRGNEVFFSPCCTNGGVALKKMLHECSVAQKKMLHECSVAQMICCTNRKQSV